MSLDSAAVVSSTFEPDRTPPPREGPEHCRVLLVDDDPHSLTSLETLLAADGYEVSNARSADEAIALFRKEAAHIVITDLVMPGGKSGIDLTKAVKERSPMSAVLLVTAHSSMKTAVSGLKAGAFDYITKPIEPRKVRLMVSELARDMPSDLPLRTAPADNEVVQFDGFIARSKAMKQVFQQIQLAAGAETTVLVCGESGTGKELVAASIHRRSQRSRGPFVGVHTGAIPPDLVPSELFGHEKGAFTGALESKGGHFEAAEGGTLFLDEVNTMDSRTQVALLRVLETLKYTRVGGHEEKTANIRVVAATNRDLAELVQAGQFREDLYYRLNVFAVRLPPLRDRREDIGVLTQHFADIFARRYRKPESTPVPETLDLLGRYPWPGNVRELRNVIEHMVILSADGRLTPDLLPRLVAGSADDSDYVRIPLGTKMKEIERTMIARTLDANDWNKQQAAKVLGISRRSLYNKLERYRITRGPR
jgi:DNA-binding NtrC family response regulator